MTASFSSDSPARPADERLLAVPNLSEGADPGIVAELRSSLGPRVALLDEHSDAVHNRTVFTIAGDEAALLPALLRLARTAIERIDLTRQRGAHPRIGALDVCPIVFHDPALRPRAIDLARAVAKQLGTLGLPIFLYGGLASGEERRERAFFRRGGHVGLTRRMREGDPAPDFGPGRPHPTAGAVLVTARPPLAAFNLELEPGAALEAGREIAAGLREAGGGCPGSGRWRSSWRRAGSRSRRTFTIRSRSRSPGSSPPSRSWPDPAGAGPWPRSWWAWSPRQRSRATPTTCRSRAPIRGPRTIESRLAAAID